MLFSPRLRVCLHSLSKDFLLIARDEENVDLRTPFPLFQKSLHIVCMAKREKERQSLQQNEHDFSRAQKVRRDFSLLLFVVAAVLVDVWRRTPPPTVGDGRGGLPMPTAAPPRWRAVRSLGGVRCPFKEPVTGKPVDVPPPLRTLGGALGFNGEVTVYTSSLSSSSSSSGKVMSSF